MIMSDMVLDIRTLPEIIFSKTAAEKVRIHEENGTIILTPIIEKKRDFDALFGMFSDGRISTEEYMKEKQIEKELEN
jgi:virulence-associated protein VagC